MRMALWWWRSYMSAALAQAAVDRGRPLAAPRAAAHPVRSGRRTAACCLRLMYIQTSVRNTASGRRPVDVNLPSRGERLRPAA